MNIFEQIRGAWWHLVHGLFPNWQVAERNVSSPDYDHTAYFGPKHTTGYWAHLIFNLDCMACHLNKALGGFK